MTNAKRQLAAIMFTDLVGYTAMMGKNSQKALDLIHASKEIQRSHVLKHNGKWLKEMGDGNLAQFNTALDAVNCAIEIQKTARTSLEGTLRIGIHLGDVTIENEDVFGDGVNVASRLESKADPGGIYISDAIWKAIQGQTDIKVKDLGDVPLKNVSYKVRVYAVQGEGFPVPAVNRKPLFMGIGIIVLLVSGFFGYEWFETREEINYVRTELIPGIREMMESSEFTWWEIYDKIELARTYIPGDPELTELAKQVTQPFNITSEPQGAKILIQDYSVSSGTWKLVGTTPITEVQIPRGASKLRFELEGFVITELPVFRPRPGDISVTLHKIHENPGGMTYIKGQVSRLTLSGFDNYPRRELGDFWIDKFEVSNKEFKLFVDQGGYRDQKYWTHKILDHDKELSFEEAMDLFRDRTGRNGPADWEAGSYPDGQGDYPVGGVSWYEAAAYSEFVGKQLPSIYHWTLVADTRSSEYVIPASNLISTGPMPVGESGSMNRNGTFDLSGNVREWVHNRESKTGDRFILGGGWDDAAFAFTDALRLPPIDRSSTNGIRCIIPIDTVGQHDVYAELEDPSRDFYSEEPIPEGDFNLLVRQYSYDKGELDPVLLSVDSANEWWIKQKVEINAAYGNERVPVYIFLPKNGNPPYQTSVFFPGDGGFHVSSIDEMWIPSFILQNGRALVVPVFKSTYERRDELESAIPIATNQYREHVIMWSKDLMRTVDYLEERGDIDLDKLSYFGHSWGGMLGPIMMHSEKRFKVGILYVGGLLPQSCLPEVDPFNFLPRVKTPVLMLNGAYDFYFPVESSQRPMFDNWGTPEADKLWKIYKGSHYVPRTELIKESLAWLDKYMGQVNN